MAQDFAAAIDDWVKKTEKRTIDVFRTSAATAADVMSRPWSEGGRLPVVTGNLRRSLAASTIGPPATLWGQKDFKDNSVGLAAVIDGAQLGQTIWLVFQAIYARKIELDNGFVRLTEQNWRQIVEASVAEVKSGTGE